MDMTGWFGFQDSSGNDRALRLERVESWTIHRMPSEPSQIRFIRLRMMSGHEIEVADPDDTSALAVILERIEFTS